MTYQADLSAIGLSADSTISGLNAQVASLQAELASTKAKSAADIAALNAEIARLNAIIAGQNPPPVYPPPVVTPPSGSALRFKPPVLTSPVVIDLNKGQTIPKVLDNTKDYRIILPTNSAVTRAGTGLEVIGGRNTVIVGGLVKVSPSGGVARAAYIKDNVGTVHLEGVRFQTTTGDFTEGIDMSCPNAVVQIQNCWVDGLCSGSYATNHADIIQTWNGPKTLRVDGLKGRTNYQVAFLNARDTNASAQPIEGTWEIHRGDFESVNGAYTLWLVTPPATVKTSKVHCWGTSKGEWKPAMWPGILHTKPTEDFTGGAGLTYVSPGYL